MLGCSFKLSPYWLVAVINKSYCWPFLSVMTYSRAKTSKMTSSFLQSPTVPLLLTSRIYTVYCVMSAPLLFGFDHFNGTSSLCISPGTSIMSGVSGIPEG